MARVPSARGIANALVVALLVGLVATQAFSAFAGHEPANKVAASSNTVRNLGAGPNSGQDLVIVSETIRVSSVADLILSATSECGLVTAVTTGDEPGGQANDTSEARATIDYYITIDGETVPVSTAGADDGRIVFCDRLYRQTTSDAENDGDIDRLDSYIESNTANGFNWLALNVGKEYDSEGDNVVDLELHAVFAETATVNSATADAFVGRTSLIIEPTNVSVHEQVIPTDESVVTP